jgi:hypothetical protein
MPLTAWAQSQPWSAGSSLTPLNPTARLDESTTGCAVGWQPFGNLYDRSLGEHKKNHTEPSTLNLRRFVQPCHWIWEVFHGARFVGFGVLEALSLVG